MGLSGAGTRITREIACAAASTALRWTTRLLLGSALFMVTSGSFMPSFRSLRSHESREAGWVGALDSWLFNDYMPL